jgi:uncharacterized membrane protein
VIEREPSIAESTAAEPAAPAGVPELTMSTNDGHKWGVRDRLWSPAQLAPFVLALAAFAAYSAAEIYRFDRFGSTAFDLGIQAQAVWGYSHFKIVPNTVLGVPNDLGDHFDPILTVLGPLFWIWDDPRVLLLVQSFLLASASLPVFSWARQRLGLLTALVVQASSLLFWGMLSAVAFDFHHGAFAVPALAFALYAVMTRKDRLLWPMVVVGLLTREDVSLTFLGLAVYVGIFQRRWRLALSMGGISAAWFLFVMYVVIPALSPAGYRHWAYPALGPGPISAALHVITHPTQAVSLFFTPLEKTKTLLALLSSWLFLPLGSPISLVALPALVERFWSSDVNTWTPRFQYSMILMPPMAFATVEVLARLRTRLQRLPFRLDTQDVPRSWRIWTPTEWLPTGLAGMTLLTTVFVAFAGVQPFRDFSSYLTATQASQLDSCLRVIPPAASVDAGYYLVPHLASRQAIFILPPASNASYLAVDPATEPNETVKAQTRQIVLQALANGYGVACSRGLALVLERGSGSARLSPQMSRFLGMGP